MKKSEEERAGRSGPVPPARPGRPPAAGRRPRASPSSRASSGIPVVLTIAGSDTSGGAGIQLDARLLPALGLYGASVVTALTAQNTQGILRIHHVPPRFVAAQIDAVALDLPIAAVRTGMLGRAEVVSAVAERIRRRGLPNVVADPVLRAKDGTPLVAGRALERIRRELLPLAAVATPNVPEAEALSGIEIRDAASLREAGLRIAALGPRAVVIKGGHREGEPVDTLFYEGAVQEMPGPRVEGPPVHGTGCLYAAAVAAGLARGLAIPECCAEAKALVERAIRGAVSLGRGVRLIARLDR